ncbi:MAG: HD domain-containing protein, partial [Thermodesulfobacteriota bacterium]
HIPPRPSSCSRSRRRLSSSRRIIDEPPRTAAMHIDLDSLPDIDLRHFLRLTDDTGIFQHATFVAPDHHHGYSTDDNARALIAALLHARLRGYDDSHVPVQRFVAFIAYVLGQMVPEADRDRMVAMCLVHDLPESRIGDQNYVNKQYVRPDEERAIRDLAADIPFGEDLAALIAEFNAAETLEARLARDADQLALILDLKSLRDVGFRPPEDWLPPVMERLQTEPGRRLAKTIIETRSDAWWRKAIEEG